MLVLGGTQKGCSSNRMEEDACELVPCLDKAYHESYLAALRTGSLESIGRMLQQLHNVNVNIVGSRGYVYSSEKLANLVVCVSEGAFINLSSFPRTAGLRAAIIKASGE